MNALTSGSLRVMRGTRAILDIEGVALPSGAVTMILGPNGAGKTTLLRALMGFEGQREIIVKSLGSIGRSVKGVVGAVDLERNNVALVLDLPSLLLFRSLRA